MEEIYARALWRMIDKGMEPKKAVHALYETLKARGREVLMPRIANEFERLATREAQKHTLTLSIAHEKDTRTAKAQVKNVLSELGLDTDDVALAVDETLIGGWRLEGREHLVDASFKKQLLALYNRATQS